MSPVAVGGIIYNNYGFVNNYNNYGFVNNESNPSEKGTLDPNIQGVLFIYCILESSIPIFTWIAFVVYESIVIVELYESIVIVENPTSPTAAGT